MFNKKSMFQADAYQRAMDHLFESTERNPNSLIQFQAAGKVTSVTPTQKAQEWADGALGGAKLKPAYAAVDVSGLLLLRDSLVTRFAVAH